MATIFGNGRPTMHTKGTMGQLYWDQDYYGKLYKCVDDDEYSDLHGAPVGGYRWEEVPATCDNANAVFAFVPMQGGYVCTIPFDQFAYMFGMRSTSAELLSTPSSGGKAYAVYKKAVEIRKIMDMSSRETVFQFTFLKDDGGMQKFEFKSDETVTEITT